MINSLLIYLLTYLEKARDNVGISPNNMSELSTLVTLRSAVYLGSVFQRLEPVSRLRYLCIPSTSSNSYIKVLDLGSFSFEKKKFYESCETRTKQI